jgi:hypothetical protein
MIQIGMCDAQPSVWGVLTSSSFSSWSFITPTPSHFLSVTLDFSVIINNNVVYSSNFRDYRSRVQVSDMSQVGWSLWLTGDGSNRWSDPPALGHRTPVRTGYTGRNELSVESLFIEFLTGLTIVFLSYQETQYGQQFWNSDTRTMKLRVGPVNSYEHQ